MYNYFANLYIYFYVTILLGDEYEYLCQGLKEKDQSINIFIDWDEYDKNFESELENGILTMKISRKKDMNSDIKVKSKSSKESIKLI